MISPVSSALGNMTPRFRGSNPEDLEYQLHTWESEGGSPGPVTDHFERTQPEVYNLLPADYVPTRPPAPATPKSLDPLPEPYALAEPEQPAQPLKKPKPAKTPKVEKPKSGLARFFQKIRDTFRSLFKKTGG